MHETKAHKHRDVRKGKVVQNTLHLSYTCKKYIGLGVKLEIAEGLETTIVFCSLYSAKPLWF